MAVAATKAARATVTLSTSPQTITAAAIGTASADRIVEFTLDCQSGAAFPAVSGVTIGGVTATKGVEIIGGGGNKSDCLSKWWAFVPSSLVAGTTADIVMTFSSTPTASADYTTYAITGANTTSPVPASASTGTQIWSSSNAAKTVTVDVPANGAAICSLTGYISRGSLSWTTTGATEQDDTANIGSTAVYTTASTQAGHDIQSTPSGTVAGGAMAVVVYQPPGAAANYALTAATGAYTLTGIAALKKISKVAAVGSYTLTGIAAAFVKAHGYVLAADVGSYILTGIAALKKISKVAATGTYTLTGIAAALLKSGSLILTAAAGAYVLTGKAVLFHKSISFAANVGSYIVTGGPVVLDLTRKIGHVVLRRLRSAKLTGIRANDAVLMQTRAIAAALKKLRS